MEKSKTLLQKYQIPINHLDFAYIKECKNAREMEKIVMILRSGEEGYFPDLTRCAEEKLKELKPESKLFRVEEQIRRSNVLDKQELEPIYNWTNDIKNKDSALNELKEEAAELTMDMPPVRKPSKIEIDSEEAATKNFGSAPKPNANPQSTSTNTQRIKSTDYSKWDKYDPDEEILRMDLEEERSKEQAQIKIHNTEPATTKTKEHIKICEQAAEEQRLQSKLKNLRPVEREQYAEKYRLRGNEYFRAKEYDSAIKEYTHAIVYDPAQAARAFNNRALCYLKLKNYLPAIDDCEACLRLEPENVKALLRLADANYGQGRRRESVSIYKRVLDLEPNNTSAKKSLEELRLQLGELAPTHATRMIIEEHQSEKAAEETKPKAQQKPQPKAQPKPQPKAAEKPAKEYDLAELVKPNRLVKSKIASAAEALGGTLKGHNPIAGAQKQQLQQMMQQVSTAQAELRLPQNNKSDNNKKLLIQEL